MNRWSTAIGVLAAGAVLVAGCSTNNEAVRSAAAEETQIEPTEESTAPSGEPWVVSLGDSIISGEAGRWAGNQSLSTSGVDALGSSAYFDAGGGETIARCHRSGSAAIHIGDVSSLNLACSGATTNTVTDSAGNFKPGIDFYDKGDRKGQALLLEEFAATNRVEMVALSIGANDFRYGPTIERCVKAYLKPSAIGDFCKEDSTVMGYVDDRAVAKVRADTTTAILNIATAMENAGYEDSEWTLGVQLYPNLIAAPRDMRYPESGYDRQLKGGCGMRDDDLSWWSEDGFMPTLNETFRQAAADAQQERPTLQVVVVDASDAFSERTLCHNSVQRVGSSGGVDSWQDPDAVDRSEWAMEINIVNLQDTFQQESMHPNYWGQLALRSCWRQAWNGGDVRGGTCRRDGNGLNDQGEPRMRLS